MKQQDTILFLHGPFMRTSRLLLEGLAAFASGRGWQVMHFSPPKRAGEEYLRRIVATWGAIGVVEDFGVACPMPLPTSGPDVPFVCIDLDPARIAALSGPARGGKRRRVGFVCADSDQFVKMAADVLLKQDFASYAFVTDYHSRHWSERRRKTFAKTIEDAGGTVYTFDGSRQDTGEATVNRRLGKWIEELPKPCGLLAANDRIASLVLSTASRHGVDIPDMVSVIGIDNDEMLCENLSPSLSSVNADFVQGGRVAGQCLADIMSGAEPGPEPRLYGAKCFVQRMSTRRLRRQMPSVKTALDFIRRNAAEGISAADVLPILGGSRRSAELRFKAATGKSVMQEIIDIRFERLMPLLEQSHVALGALAGRTGFTSENQLQRQFKARYGTTLSAYRRKTLARDPERV